MVKKIYRIFQSLSVRRKLMLLFGTSVILSVGISTTFSLIYIFTQEKNALERKILYLAEFSAKNIAAALMFEDTDATKYILNTALTDEHIKKIVVFRRDFSEFIQLGDEGFDISLDLMEKLRHSDEFQKRISFELLEIIGPVFRNREVVGYIAFIVSTAGIKNKMYDNIIAAIVVFILTNFIMFFISIKFEKILLQPLFNLIETIRMIIERRSYDINVICHSRDEFNYLSSEFNNLIEEIRIRDEILRQYNISLEEKIMSTNKELQDVKKDLEKAKLKAKMDSLTGIYNRGYTIETLSEILKDAIENQYPVGVIMMDIDFFKNINDTYGHKSGDIVLKEVALILSKNKRKDDVVGRIGGEEFLVICKNSDKDITFSIAERIRQLIEKTDIFIEKDRPIRVTISAGVYSKIPTSRDTSENMMNRADRALYESKYNGRNRVTINFD